MNIIEQCVTDRFALYNGDSAEILKTIPSNSIHYEIYSPPFSNLYTYSSSERDLGNCKNDEEFYQQFKFIADELYRVLMDGRLMSVHCMNFPSMKERDGFIGLKDFRGDLIRLFQSCGFIYHSEVTIFKDPVVAMQRTKALGLLNKQKNKDSAMSRQGIPDYLVTFRKTGDNPVPITHTNEDYPVSHWQEVASPVWDIYPSPVWWDINQSDTLQARSVREEKDERHICPLQLPVIKNAVELWTNEGETVLTPFLGIGSEAYQALIMKRKAIGIELKSTYYKQAVANCKAAIENDQISWF